MKNGPQRKINSNCFSLGQLDHLREELLSSGKVIVNEKFLPWNQSELKLIEERTSPKNIVYSRTEYGDTGERNPVSYFRLLHPEIQETFLPECLKLIRNKETKAFFLSLTGLSDFTIDRCKVHLYQKGDFIALHNDNESCPEYLYTVILLLSEDYIGGELIVKKDSCYYSLKPEMFSMIVINSFLSHEVKEIFAGLRRAFVFFLRKVEPYNS